MMSTPPLLSIYLADHPASQAIQWAILLLSRLSPWPSSVDVESEEHLIQIKISKGGLWYPRRKVKICTIQPHPFPHGSLAQLIGRVSIPFTGCLNGWLNEPLGKCEPREERTIWRKLGSSYIGLISLKIDHSSVDNYHYRHPLIHSLLQRGFTGPLHFFATLYLVEMV